MLIKSTSTARDSGHMFIGPEHLEAVTYMAIAFRAYTARHDPSLCEFNRRWVKACIEAGEQKHLPPYAPGVSNYSSFVVTPAVYIIDITCSMAMSSTMTQNGTDTALAFIRQHYDTMKTLANEDALIRWLMERFSAQYTTLRTMTELLGE